MRLETDGRRILVIHKNINYIMNIARVHQEKKYIGLRQGDKKVKVKVKVKVKDLGKDSQESRENIEKI